jgi:hypothetical protein
MNGTGLGRRLPAEFVGSALLVTIVVGSGIAAAQLSPGDVGLQLLENSTATVFGLGVLILLFGPVSGAHFNPAVTAADWLLGRRSGTGIGSGDAAAYVLTQIVGAITGCWLANVMFDRRVFELATKDRTTTGHLIGEVVATAGLIDLRAGSQRPCSIVRSRRGSVYRRGLLVHQLDVVRQPRGHHRADVLRHLCRNRSEFGAGIHCRSTPRHAHRSGAHRQAVSRHRRPR